MATQSELKKLAQIIQTRLQKFCVAEYEIYIEAKKGMNLELKQGERDLYEVKEGLGFGLRLIHEQRLSFSYGFDFSITGIDYVIEQCLSAAQHYPQDAKLKFAMPFRFKAVEGICDPQFDNITFEHKVALLHDLEKQTQAYGGAIEQVSFVALDDEQEDIYLTNSNGLEAYQKRSAFCVSLGALASLGEDKEIAYAIDSFVCFADIDVAELARQAAQHALDLVGGIALLHYEGPVIIDSKVMQEFLDLLASSFRGDHVYKKISALEGRLDKKIYANCVTLIDDGSLAGGVGSKLFDGEGLPTQKNILVQDGKLKGYLYDLYWAARAGANETASSSRDDLTEVPHISYHNFYLQTGSQSQTDLMHDMQEGILIQDVIGLHNADEVSGDFSVGIQGVLVKAGQKQKAIKSMLFSGNLHRLLKEVTAVGNDIHFCAGIGAPSILVKKVKLAGATESDLTVSESQLSQ